MPTLAAEIFTDPLVANASINRAGAATSSDSCRGGDSAGSCEVVHRFNPFG